MATAPSLLSGFRLPSAGLSSPSKFVKAWDYTAGTGGPIKKDRLWYLFRQLIVGRLES